MNNVIKAPMLNAMERLPFPQPQLEDYLKYCYYNGIDLTLPAMYFRERERERYIS